MSGGMKQYYKKIFKGRKEEFLEFLEKRNRSGRGSFVVTANPEIFMIGKKNSDMEQALLDENTLIVPDGIGIIRGGGQLGCRFAERIPGVEICEALLAYADKEQKSVYLFGAKKHVLDALVKRLNSEYKGIVLSGYTDGYVSDKESVFRRIIELNPDIVLVALGAPAQELLIHKFFRTELKGIYMGVGGSFDVLSGLKKRAPAFFIKYNLEWLYRIATEPSRLKRFWDSNVRFLFELRKEKNGNQ